MSKKFNIIKKKNLPDNAVIRGFTFLKESDEDKQDFAAMVSNTELLCYYTKTKKFGITRGYVKIDGTAADYLQVKRRPILLLLLLGLLLLYLLLSLLGGAKETMEEEPPKINVIGEEWDGEMPGNNDKTPLTTSTEIPGYTFVYVSAEEPNIRLINPEKNTVYFKYTISLDDEVLIETDHIKPNGQVEVNLYEKLSEPGEYELKFHIGTVDVETGDPCNGALQYVTLKVY